MAKSVLNVETRVRTGKGGSRKVRQDGLVPAVVYGKGVEALNLRLDPKALQKAVATEAGWNTLITLKGNGPFDGLVVILKDMQIDAIRRNPMHVDFLAIDLNKTLAVMVPVQPVGKSKGEIEGGTLQLVRHEVEVYCLPTNIPTSLEIDVTALNIGEVVHIDELSLPEGVESQHDVNFTVLTVVGRMAEEVEVGEEGEEGEEEVVTEEAADEE
ncbi:MAG: 50S ribosomal protein L25 [Desulfuromonadales bacterium]|jgi:large subunit ribosomal protein L25|nr:50S ribosomal protein L25 [Desulfuromonadales bacterium]MDH3807827.1 50S ribosomal protein L25 [Desulfuromonadales bacterium]MDH3868031.1 50S ribosomal protein L25 [Desulfuromonadales bacterium]MDH4024366.1 50S ribosomal protein L25 [Desulfuromonadales bacterium]HKJ29396.1 50S ribosomal protein L25 [Desulfuromonadales bacterium]